jgi:hypothetical protein
MNQQFLDICLRNKNILTKILYKKFLSCFICKSQKLYTANVPAGKQTNCGTVHGIFLSNKKKWTLNPYIMNYSQIYWKKYKRANVVWCYAYEILEQENSVCHDRIQKLIASRSENFLMGWKCSYLNAMWITKVCIFVKTALILHCISEYYIVCKFIP